MSRKPSTHSAAAWYALRRTLPTWSFDRNLEELINVLARYRVDEVVIKIDTEEFTHGQAPVEWIKAYQPKLIRVREEMAKLGVIYSLNPWITLGHMDRGREGRIQLPGLRTLVGHDGTECTCCACPLSKVWRDNTEEAWTLYAQTQPHVLWVEDDIRTFNHLPVKYGCFCPEHLQRFSSQIGRIVTREEVVNAILQPGSPHPWRRQYLDLQAEVMNETAAFLARIVHRVAPETQLGLMSSGPRQHCLEGRQWGNFATALADGKGLYSRAPMANYWEDSLRGFYYSHDSIKLTRHCLPGPVVEQTEVENVPFTRYSKSEVFTFLEMAISFAYGSRGVTLNLFDHTGTPMETDPAFGRMLGQRKGYLNALAEKAQQPGKYCGLQLLYDENAGDYKWLHAGDGYPQLAGDGEVAMNLLEAHGIATTYDSADTAVTVGQQLRGFSDDQIKALLGRKRGLLLDAPAAAIICERGLGDLIGATAVSPVRNLDELGAYAAEEFFNPDFKGQDKKFLTLTLPCIMDRPAMSIIQTLAGAQIVSRAVDPDARRHHVCSYAFENRLGGRVFVYAFDLAKSYGLSFNHPFRREQLDAAVRWISRGTVPLLVHGNGVYPLTFRKDCGAQSLLGLFNLSLDPWTETRLLLHDSRAITGVLKLTGDGQWQVDEKVQITSRVPGEVCVHYDGAIPFAEPLLLQVSWAESPARIITRCDVPRPSNGSRIEA